MVREVGPIARHRVVRLQGDPPTITVVRDGTYTQSYTIGDVFNGWEGEYAIDAERLRTFDEDGAEVFDFRWRIGGQPIPDLEQIARLYLHALERACAGDVQWQHNYDWMMIELYDQTVRETSGGRHGSYLSREHIPNREFVVMRHGREAEDSIRGSETIRRLVAAGQYDRAPAPRAAGTHRGDGWKRALLRRIRETVVRQLLQWEYGALTLGRFRRSGEIHLWMYDSYSLGRALLKAGFVEPTRTDAVTSRVMHWPRFGLDAGDDGRPHKPDSLYMEAVKP